MSDLEDADFSDHAVISYNTNQVTLLFAKSAVYQHPTPRSRDNVNGFFSLSRRPSPTSRQESAAELLLSWQPTRMLKADEVDALSRIEQDPSADVRMSKPPYAGGCDGFCLPLTEISQLVTKPPRTGWSWGSVVVVKTDGTSMPGLFFHDDECVSTIAERKRRQGAFDPFGESGHVFWGFDSVLTVLRAITDVSRSDTAAGTYVLHPLRPKMDDALGAASSRGSKPNLKWRILLGFSRITQLGRSTADQILESDTGREILSKLPPHVRQMVTSQQAQNLADEYDSARLYLARWAASISDASSFTPPSAADDVYEEETALGMFEVLSVADVQRRERVSAAEWRSWFSPRGDLLKSQHEIRDALFHGSCEEEIMGEVWCFLLGVYPWDSDEATRKAIRASKRDAYHALKRKWFDQLDSPTPTFLEERHRIEKDIHRTDRQHPFFEHEDMPSPDPQAEWGTNAHMEQLKDILLTYNEYNAELGYVQGMSDLLAPVYVVNEDDSIAFWCFTGLMARMERNFLRDQSGMRMQLEQLAELVHFMLPKLYAHLEKCDSLNLFCFFRMILIIFKREFSFPTILNLWTVLFTNHYSPDFQLFCALAILDLHSAVMISHLRAFDEVLKYVNDLSGRMKVDEVLVRAEKLYKAFVARVREMDKRRERLVEKRGRELGMRRRTPADGHSAAATNSSGTNAPEASEEVRKGIESLTLSENLARLIGHD